MARASRLSVGSSLDSESSSLIDNDTEYSVSPYCKLPSLPATQSVRIHRFVNQGGAEIIRKDFFTFNIKQTTLLGDNVVETSSKSCTVILNPDGTIQSTGNKEDLAGLQRRWCCLIGALVSLSFITLLSTSIFSLSSFRSNSPPPPPTVMTTLEETSIVPADMVGAPRIMSRKAWVAQPPTEPMDKNTLPVQRIIVCHTATDSCQTTPDCTLQVRFIQQFHVESRKWGDIGYNFLIGGEGVVYVGRGWDEMGAHTKGDNNGTLGVAFIGTFINQLPNELQIEAFHKLVDVGVRIGKIADDYKLQAQCQLQVTAAPGLMLAQNMKSWPHFDTSLKIRCTDGGVA
uniref:Peptidoglycan recognition protein family domain-containing protein n=1 Tax=Homalodisca liturata TaxID=320908 RepID=A0A1B6IZQ8_9HEMI